ncbi:protein rolling stone-like [Saccostrea echinata]|uniref:protein rolling stone-like n=1 Tax=Saccostrea echinata TaxID=191078 RepID=UPI002A7F6E53|nr:protein rolling stone-like [Saccostrea echinata]
MDTPRPCSKEEFRVKNFLLDYDHPRDFVKFQHCETILPYLLWRLFWAVYHFVCIILTGVYSWQWAGDDPQQQVKWFIYLTDWCYFVLTVSTLVDAACVIYVYFCRVDIKNGISNGMTWYLKTNWVIFNFANSAAIVVTLMYWGLVYSGGSVTVIDTLTHGVNAVYVLVNVSVSAIPIRIYHFFHGVVFGVTYVIFTVIYYAAGGTNHQNKSYIYSVLDWDDPGITLAYCAAVGLVAMPLCHLMIYGIYALRRCPCRKNKETSQPV